MSDHPRDSLPVCPRCGWHRLHRHDEGTCWPNAGAAAQRLIDFLAVHKITATKLGYGQHSLAFKTANETMIVVLHVARDGEFTIDRVFNRVYMNEAEAGKLAVALEMFAQSRARRDA